MISGYDSDTIKELRSRLSGETGCNVAIITHWYQTNMEDNIIHKLETIIELSKTS